MAVAAHAKSTTVTINPQNQNMEALENILRHILRAGGCAACGRIAIWRFDFLVDPPAELAKSVISTNEIVGS